jgi:hypothetical protein
LAEGFRDVLVPETVEVVFEENNGKLVLISGPLVVSDPLQDATYEVSINAVKLRKVVQVTESFISFISFFLKVLVAAATFYLFIFTLIDRNTVCTIFINITRRLTLLFSSPLPLGRRPPLGCRAEIRTWACRTI